MMTENLIDNTDKPLKNKTSRNIKYLTGNIYFGRMSIINLPCCNTILKLLTRTRKYLKAK